MGPIRFPPEFFQRIEDKWSRIREALSPPPQESNKTEVLWFRRLDGSGFEPISDENCLLRIPVRPRVPAGVRVDPLQSHIYMLTRSGRWVLLKMSPEMRLVRIEVAPSDVIRDLEQNGIPVPAELSHARVDAEFNIPERESDLQIIETLRAVGHRLTTTKLISAMTECGLNPSESTVKKRLAGLVKSGQLDNDPKARPRGYGLPEWDGSRGS
jgi:hypothetical protein